jgi:vancomycin permeability regulator SanA
MEPEEDERDPAMDRDVKELETIVEKYGGFLPEILDRAERSIVTQAFSLWTGYAAFCEQSAGVDAEKLAAVVLEPAMGLIADMRARAQRLEVEADAEIVEMVRETLGESWRVVEERGV